MYENINIQRLEEEEKKRLESMKKYKFSDVLDIDKVLT